jgi:protein gp37
MGEVTSIGWTDHTLPAWRGCEKVSAGCRACYAEHSTPVRVARSRGLELWGGDGARIEGKAWAADLRKWHRAAVEAGVVRRVFALALGDIFEDYAGGQVLRADGRTQHTLDDLRRDALDAMVRYGIGTWSVGGATCGLVYQALTKRPENVARMVPATWLRSWPAHVWIGATCENQAMAEERVDHLRAIPVPVCFLSVEPMLGPVAVNLRGISWLIIGAESPQGGHAARPFEWAWAEDLVRQADAAGVPVFVKQGPGGETDEVTFPPSMRGRRAFPEARP